MSEPLTFDDFQSQARPVKRVPPNPLWPALALGGEAGELLNVRKKIERGDAGLDDAFLEEAGDLLFYLRLALVERGFSMDDAARECLAKLQHMHLDSLHKGAPVRIVAEANSEIFGKSSFGLVGTVVLPPGSEPSDRDEQLVHIDVDGKRARFYVGEVERLWGEIKPKYHRDQRVEISKLPAPQVLLVMSRSFHVPTDEYPSGYWQYALSRDGTAAKAMVDNPYKEDELRPVP